MEEKGGGLRRHLKSGCNFDQELSSLLDIFHRLATAVVQV
jgi:hypothetical protein